MPRLLPIPPAPLLLLLALYLAPSLAAQTLAVALTEQNRVLLFDARTYDSVASVPVGRAPHEIAASPDGRHFYVGNTGASGEPERLTVTRIDLADPARTTAIEAGDCAGLHDLRVSRSARLLWIACGRVPAVAEIDLATGKLRRQWRTTLDGGWMLTASPDERRIYVAHLEGQAVTMIDRERQTVATVPGPGPQIGIEVTPAGREVWVTAADSGLVTVLAAAGGRVLATLPSGGAGPARVRFTPDGRLAVIPHDVSSTLTLLDVANRTHVASIPLTAAPKVLALSLDGRFPAVSHPEAKLISIVDLERRVVTRTIALPGTPDGVAYAAGKAPRGNRGLGFH
jgi:DNA-binding beta-propeller fold protein YncE